MIGKVFGLRNLMTFVVYGLLILLFSLTMVHWHSHIQPQFSTLSLRILGEGEVGQNQKDKTGGFLSVLHRSVKRKLISGALPLSTSIKSEWKLWGNDSQESPCSSYTTRFGEKLPKVMLLSFPCSGNTWTRYLLEAASGIFTGSIYRDGSLIKKGFLGEGRPLSETLVRKTHQNVRLSFEYHASSIRHPTLLLIRNPANALISFYKFSKSHSHVDQISYELFSSENFHKFVKTNLVKWMTLAVTSLTMNDAPLYVLYYERLLENPIEELTKVLAFLGTTTTTTTTINNKIASSWSFFLTSRN
ncbi:WSCD family member AGAP003962-like isoform X2 [Portunus trituberculatus]|uniref:WSCD family member AGAP003962-like isoform X2 n=1 Tax=Portunus trituberculatus TaxID=210409 RepID=UPI001E1CC52E|nr:WSCD family member AGAP003962-like isoform X2 [Portunus trituberculatus]